MENNDQQFPTTIRIGILVFPNFEPLDVWGFVQAFSIARFLGKPYQTQAGGPGQAPLLPSPFPFEVLFISNADSDTHAAGVRPPPVRSFNGPRVAPDLYRDEALGANIDMLMIPGGAGVYEILDTSPPAPHGVARLCEWVRAMDKKTSLTTSVCTGAAILAKSGLLDGKPAATNHQAFDWVRTFGPLVLWDNVARWVDAGRYVTSAGVSAGTDMAFYLLSRLAGRAVAEAAVLAAEYDWRRDPQQPIYYP